MSENEQKLQEGLRALAADGPRCAPAHVEERLLQELRRHTRRRRWTGWGAAGAAAAAIALAVWMQPIGRRHATPLQAELEMSVEEMAPGFYPVPGAEALPAFETAMVVRVELPLSSLRMMGFAVNDAGGTEPVQADVLLGRDGLARGVRLVQ